MYTEVEMPDLGTNGGDHGTVVEWNFEEGEFVEQGEILVEVAGDSGTVEVPCPRSGNLVERIVQEDELVRAGEPIAVIECSDEPEKSIEAETE